MYVRLEEPEPCATCGRLTTRHYRDDDCYDCMKKRTAVFPMDELQAMVGTWAGQTFPEATTRSILTHLHREYDELKAEYEGDFVPDQFAEEMADMVLLLFHLAHREDVSLHGAILKKFATITKWKWGKPDADGVVEHIRTESEAPDAA